MRRSDLIHPCTVDVSSVFDYIRTIRLFGSESAATVRVEYDNEASHAIQEGGFYFQGKFPSLDDAVVYLEKYLRRPFGDWTLYRSGTLPTDRATALQGESFWTALRENRVDLPDPDRFVLQNSEFFRDRLPFPSRYRRRA